MTDYKVGDIVVITSFSPPTGGYREGTVARITGESVNTPLMWKLEHLANARCGSNSYPPWRSYMFHYENQFTHHNTEQDVL